jgi:hypothetical protein
MSVVVSFTMSTPCETEYGSDMSYFSWRVGLIEIWFAIMSKRPASSPAKMPSNWVSLNSASTPSSAATACATSTSYPVRSPLPPSWKLYGE